MIHDSVRNIADALIASLNAGDVDAFVALFTPDTVIDDPSIGHRFEGHAGIGFVAQIVARDSRGESILVAGRDEQAAADAIPHDELVLLQFGAEDARFTDGVV